jgi:hypothetical protein
MYSIEMIIETKHMPYKSKVSKMVFLLEGMAIPIAAHNDKVQKTQRTS